ncbi:3-methyl-2-oxobutanoate hydroxymethyltransferase [Candidatus Berkiella aquae]|uniref:3-methyl-2-oxobutanoate hydroxymethyltransferase n=1 Tax=Candidatus Berkiella aquae TaxID=295108 RepID=A0A0Q9YW29_9GAMM|nr:3-methyl-2-oxobutanoate hydroxymethyltransferase [Candidatus Berkiella aquae]MCS5711230.1 3-methyl-2-oxobutanoate hydroxymethyltransferase [Candidatus Berkiella aquae]
MNITDFRKMKASSQKISMIVCYDHWSAQIVNQSKVDCILVGDSAAMVIHGHNTTLPATVDMMIQHIQAVAKGAPQKFIVGDMPFCSYRKGLTDTMETVDKMMKAGSHAIKLEGADDNASIITHIVKSGIPVMGHIGLTPQSVHSLGGFKVQGRQQDAADRILEQALTLQDAGCFSLVLECIPYELAKRISAELTIPTIGIGAGPYTDGQVLVLQDMLGLQTHKPKFLKTFMEGFSLIKTTLDQYDNEVKSSTFPTINEHSYEHSV